MVNSLQRSRACKLCRARRIRCDETKPFCLKCRKAKRVCPGYWNPLEVTILDETEATIRKATLTAQSHPGHNGRQDLSGPRSQIAHIQSQSPISQHWKSTSINFFTHCLSASRMSSPTGRPNRKPGANLTALFSLQTPVDEQATCFFLSNFVLIPQNSDGKSYLSFIARMLVSPHAQSSPFPMCFKAAATAALAGRPNCTSLLAKARMYYSLALRQLSQVLNDHKMLNDDDLCLASVILLSFCEALSTDHSAITALSGWSNHLDGAKALIRLRGAVLDSSTQDFLEMFQFVRAAMIRQYMFGFLSSTPPWEELSWWGEHVISDKTSHAALMLNMKTARLRAEVDALLAGSSRTTAKIDRALDLLQQARQLLARLTGWVETSSSTPYAHQVVKYIPHVPDDKLTDAFAFPGWLFDYPNLWVAGKHLNTNASRVVLAGIAARCMTWICAPSNVTATSDYAEIKHLGDDAVASVVSSLPYFTRWSGDSTSTPFFPGGTPTDPKSFASMISLYPLLATILSEFATARQKKFIRGRMAYMAEMTGFRQAELFAKMGIS